MHTLLLQVPGSGTYVDYSFYQKFGSFEETIKAAFTEVLAGMGNLGDVASALAAIGATLYIGFKVLRHLGSAEGVDVFPLMRPFCLGFLVLNFTIVTDFLGACIKPIAQTTQFMVDMQTTRIQQIETLRAQKMEEHMKQMDQQLDDMSLWHTGQYIMLMIEKQRAYFNNALDAILKTFFYAIFLAARLVILTTQSFYLIILTIIGPLAFALAIFTGFQDSHLMWIARYVQISLWLPLANILGSMVSYMQAKVISLQYLELVNNVPDEAQSGPTIYIVFMIIATLCYFTIPTISGFIISSSGVGNALQRVTNLGSTVVGGAISSGASGGALNSLSGAGGSIINGGKMAYGAGAMGVGAGVWAGGHAYNGAKKGINAVRNMRNISNSQD